MKIKTPFLAIILSLVSTIVVYGQVQWTKYINNPVLTKGPAYYDITALGQPTVLIENDTIKIWYTAVGGDKKSRIGYAWSTDGINWTKHSDIVIDTGYPGEWDSKWLDTPEILKVDSGYLLYYYGDSLGYDTSYHHNEPATHSAIGLAYSTDGVNWTKYVDNPIFSRGNYGEWDGTWVESPALFRNDTTGELYMWYNGVDTITWKIQIGLATSTDGINWTRHPNNPILTVGNTGTYDDAYLGTPAVIYKTNHFEMWYSSTSSQDYNVTTHKFDTLRICFATSPNGIDWTKYPNNPLFNTGTAPYDSLIDKGGPWAADVVYIPDSNQYKLWYETEEGICLAFSDSSFVYVGIQDNQNLQKLKIYPNPTESQITIKFDNPKHKKYTLNIYNYAGQKVKTIDNIYSSKIILNMQDFSRGIYLIELKNEQKIITNKIILN